MKRTTIFGLAVLLCTAAMGFAGAGTLEQAIGVRPGTLFYSTDRDASTISNGNPDEVPFYGWGGTTGAMADFNGDGIDDKVLYQANGTGWQTLVSYSSPTGSIMNTNLDIIGSSDWSWLNVGGTGDKPIYGDVDGDGIADNGITVDGATAGGSAGALTWGAYRSNGTAGLASGVNFTNYSAFGVYATDTPLMGDINGDGMDDRVLFRNDFSTYVDYGVAGNYGDGSVDTQSIFGGVVGDQLAIADINGDNYDDVVVIRANGAGNYYDLFGYYSSAAGLSIGASPDLLGVAGSLSDGDYLVFGDLGQAAGTDDNGSSWAWRFGTDPKKTLI